MKIPSSFVKVLALLGCVLTLGMPVLAAEVDCDSTYCFSGSDFDSDEELAGVCITDLPDAAAGTVLLGSRVIRPGDILTAEQLAQMTFSPLLTEEDQSATVCYLPIYDDRVEREAAMTIAIHGKQDNAPVAEDSAVETYKNLEATGNLKVSDPEGKPLVYTVTRQPKRGSVEIREDGSFIYTPKKNKVGVDSFVFTAADPAGNVSREATVTIQIIKPTDSTLYTDTASSNCRFTAEWLKNTGIFSGEQVGGDYCFSPSRAVTRGEFLAMTMKALEILPDAEAQQTGFEDECPPWLKPYLAAAQRSGLVRGYATETGAQFLPDQAITGEEAASILSAALELPAAVLSEDNAEGTGSSALATVQNHEIALTDSVTVTREETANALYQAVRLKNQDSEVN